MNSEYEPEIIMQDYENNRTLRRHDSPFLDYDFNTETEAGHASRERLAYNMKVSNINFQYGAKACGSHDHVHATNSILETVSIVTSSWKKQAEALALAPLETVAFYRRQYNNLNTVLSVALFNETPTAALKDNTEQEETLRTISNGGDANKNTEGKRKRNATSNNDCEYIFFQKGDKFVYRRVESAPKYAKKMKPVISRYIWILPKNDACKEQTRNCMSKIRTFDPTFASGNEVKKFGGDDAALFKEIQRLVDCVSLNDFSDVKFIDEIPGNEESVTEEAPKPAKRAKVEESSKKKRQGAEKRNAVKTRPIEDTRRSHVEQDTESSDDDNAGTENPERPSEDAASMDRRVEIETAYAVESIKNAHVSTEPVDEAQFELPPSPFLVQTTTAAPNKSASKKSKRKHDGGPARENTKKPYNSTAAQKQDDDDDEYHNIVMSLG